MGDDDFDTSAWPPADRPAKRRAMLRAFSGGLFIAIAQMMKPGATARTRPRRMRRRRHDVKGVRLAQDLAACDPNATSGIAGLVLIGPMCPVMTQDDPCPDPPYAATIVVRDSQGNAVCTTASGEDGIFRVGLPPGQYELDPVNGPYGLPYASAQTVLVEPGLYTEVLVSYDSGIR